MSFGVIYFKPSNITLARRHPHTYGNFVDDLLPIESYEVVGDVLTYVFSKKYAKNDPWIVCTGVFNPKTEDYYKFATIIEEGKPETIMVGHSHNTLCPEYSAQYRATMDKLLDDVRPLLLPSYIENDDFHGVLDTHMRKYLRYRRRVVNIDCREREIVHLFNKGDTYSVKSANDKLTVLNSESDTEYVKTVAAFFTREGKLKSSATIKAMESTYKHCSCRSNGNRTEAADIMLWCMTDVDRVRLYEINPLLPTDECLNAKVYGEHCSIKQLWREEYYNKKWRGIILDVMGRFIEPAINKLLVSEAQASIHDMWGRENYYSILSRITRSLKEEAEDARQREKAMVINPEVAALAVKHGMSCKVIK